MKHFVNRGHTIQLNWTLHSISGQEFALTGHTYKLFFATGNQSAQATGVTHSGNVLSWTFTPNAQWKLGSYTIWLEVYNNGTKIVTVAYPDAFHLAHEVANDGTTQTGTQTESTTLNLVSSCDFYRFAPVVPVAGEDGYWYVNGEKAVDGSGEYILTSHTLEYDETTRNLIIDRGRVDSEGHSIEQVITALADLDSYYQAAEGSEDGSVAGDGSRWGSYKTAENARNTAAQNAETARQSAASAAEGSSAGSVAGDGSRWGEFKSAEAERETASETAIARANAAAAAAELMVNIHQGPPGDDGEDGTGIEEVEQTETSIANGGTNKVRITLTDGTYYDIQIKNGSSSAGLFPTSSALAAACPSPKVGDYAFVGDGFPADIYVCATAGTWTDSGEDYDGDNVDLTDYATKAEVNQLEAYLGEHLDDKFVTVALPSESDFSLGANTVDGNRWTNSSAKHIALSVTPGEIYSLVITAGVGNFYGLFTEYAIPTAKNSPVYYESGSGRVFKEFDSAETRVTIPNGITYLIICTVDGNGNSSTWSVKKKVSPSIDDDFVAKDEIVNNTTEGGADKPLSAEMGKRLANEANKVFINEDEELPSASYAFYLHANGIWRTGGIHKAIQVTPGQKIRLRTLNSSNGGNFYAWLTSSYSPPPTDWDAIPYVSGTNRIWITDASGWNTLTVPNTAAYLIIELKTGGGDTSEWQLQSLNEMGTSEAFEQFVISGGGSNIPADLPKYGYDGPRVSTEERHFVATGKVSTITSVSCQGGACFGDYLFMFTEYNTTCWMYNLASETLVQAIEIPSEERGFVGQCHCNTVNFGTEKYDADDPFPLIYVSTGCAAGGYSGALAYRIVATTEDDVTTYSLTLVQTLKLPGSGWTEFVVGEEGFCYLCYTDERKIYKMKMPTLSDGDMIFDLEQALSVYQFPLQPSWFNGSRNQNRLYHNGKIYLVSGVPGGSEALLFIVLDLATERREVVIDLKNTLGLTPEPETVFIWDGHFCIVFRSNANVYALYFD